MPRLSQIIIISGLSLLFYWGALVLYPELYWYQASLINYWSHDETPFIGKTGFFGPDAFCITLAAIPLLAWLCTVAGRKQSLWSYFISLFIILLTAWLMLWLLAAADASRFGKDMSISRNKEGNFFITSIRLEKIYMAAVATGTGFSLLLQLITGYLQRKKNNNET